MQDAEMKSQFERFPETVLMDATHKTNNLDMPLYTMATIDGNKETQVAASFLVENEDEDSISYMMQLFKKRNPNSKKQLCYLLIYIYQF